MHLANLVKEVGISYGFHGQDLAHCPDKNRQGVILQCHKIFMFKYIKTLPKYLINISHMFNIILPKPYQIFAKFFAKSLTKNLIQQLIQWLFNKYKIWHILTE